MTDDRTYQLTWPWPYQLVGAMLVVLGVSYLPLRHFVEWRQIERSDWLIAAAFVAGGVVTAVYYRLRVVVNDEGLTRIRPLVTERLAWHDIHAVRIEQNQFVLLGANRRNLAVPTAMRNGLRFAQDLDARIAEGRHGLKWEAEAPAD